MYNTKFIMSAYNQFKEESVTYSVKATNGNTKLGKSICNINLPPIITCNPTAPCFKECYGRKGRFVYKSVKDRMMKNLMAFCQNPKQFFEDVAHQTKNCNYVRWFGNGDMPNEEFLIGMCQVARKNPNTRYLAFTKQYNIVNNHIAAGHRIPSNLNIVFSTWRTWVPNNPYNMPTAWVKFPEEGKSLTRKQKAENIECNKLIPAKAFKCLNDCSNCQSCWHLKRGTAVEFHKH